MKENERVKNSKILSIMILLIIIIGIIILFAYARYITSIDGGTHVAEIARWNFNVTAGSTQSLDIDLASTRIANDTTGVSGTVVAPGTKGALVLDVNASRK